MILILCQNNRLLFAITDIIDQKIHSALQADLQPLKDDIRNIKLHLENTTDKNIQLLAENYVPAAKRYEKAAAQMETMESDMDVMKNVIREHSEKLQKIS